MNIEIFDENNKLIDTENIEYVEQKLVDEYIIPTDVVLELGARYGSVSCKINKILNIKTNQVSVEPDERVWDALEKNKQKNDCNFNIVKGFISKRNLNLTNLHVCRNGYGSTFIFDESTNIQSYSLDFIEEQYNLKFNALVADCEGGLEIFLDENPKLYSNLRIIIFEADYKDKCDYEKIKYNLSNSGFINILNGFQNVWRK